MSSGLSIDHLDYWNGDNCVGGEVAIADATGGDWGSILPPPPPLPLSSILPILLVLPVPLPSRPAPPDSLQRRRRGWARNRRVHTRAFRDASV